MPAERSFLIAGLLSFGFVAGVLEPWLSFVALGGDLILLLALLLDVRRARASVVEARRTHPTVLVQAATAPCSIELVSATRHEVTVVLREALHPDLAPAPVRERLVVPATGSAVWRYTLRPRRRGEPSFGPLSARILGPWRLGWSQRELLPPEPVRVYPQTRFDGQVGRILALAHRRELGQSPLRTRGLGREPYALRNYHPGDSLNRIHWKASARHSRLISREDAWERGRPLVVLLECARAMVSLDGERSKLDHALAAALALVRVAMGRGDRVSVIAFSDRIERLVRIHPSGGGVADAYRKLFDLPARLAEPSYDLAAETVLRTETRRATIALFTSVADLASAESLREALLRLRRRHQVQVVNLEDADLIALTGCSPSSPPEAYAKTSALEVLLANRRLGRHLRRAGIIAHSTAADRLAQSSLEAYLRLAGHPGARRSA